MQTCHVFLYKTLNTMKRSQIIEFIIHLIFWLPLTVYLLFTEDSLTFGVFNTSEKYYSIALIYGLLFNAFFFYTTIYKVLPSFFKQRKYLKGILASLVFFVFISFLEGLIDLIFISTIYESSNLAEINENPFSYVILGALLINSPFILIAYSYRFTKDWYINERIKHILKEEKLRSELQFLKSQINPHFLFNTLNNLFGIARKIDAMPVADGIAKLSNMMRYMLYDSEVDLVSLEKEVKYINDYIELQKLRIESLDNIDLNVNLTDYNTELKIAPLLLIPFVENAFKHGISIKEKSEIKIELNTKGNTINFGVVNSINKFRKNRDDENSGFGLRNVQKRLDLLYPDNYSLKINEEIDKYQISLTINTQV